MKIILAGTYPAGTRERFGELLPGHDIVPVATQEEFEQLHDADCIIVRILRTTSTVIENNKELKAVIRWGAGYDSVDIETAGRQGVLVANTPGVNGPAVAELAVGLMVLLSRKIVGYHQNVRDGNWDRQALAASSYSLAYKKVGIIGSGAIGRRVAALTQAFGAEVQYFDAFRMAPQAEQELGMRYVELPELFETSDLVTLHVPLLDSTHHIVGAERLASMKSTATVINTARGGLVDDAALLECLRAGGISGAGLDCVEDEESQTTAELLQCPNVVLTPHIGGTTADLGDAMVPVITDMVRTLADTGDMPNVVNREWLDGRASGD